ncbi:MAG: TetR family transcriptional regulator C-terminal domain-containing protein [Proteobacteria bacterium]|nr:TetR family transcriptional regulator C-terminal domain-containing protein [Pseudomonadota bacterium]MBS0270999.1 TetR family transcriptional regulator C-terminal domain-containing protein [Pseudomonadota bacterium]
MTTTRIVQDLRRVRGDVSRRMLVQATINSVAQYGLANTTITTVAGLAGVSRALVGFHFKSKDQLLTEALEDSLATYEVSLKEALDAAGPNPKKQLEAILLHDVNFSKKHPELLSLWCAVWGESKGVAHYRQSVLPSDRAFRDDIASCIEKIVGDRKEARKRALIINAFLFGIWLDYHLDPDEFDLASAREAALTLLEAVTSYKRKSK